MVHEETQERKQLYIKVSICLFIIALLLSACIVYRLWDKTKVPYTTIFSIGFDLAGLFNVSALCIVYSLDKVKPDKSTWLFYGLILIDAIAVYCYIINWIIAENTNFLLIKYITGTVNYLCSPTMCFVFWSYQDYLFPGNGKTSIAMTKFIHSFMPLDMIYIFSNVVFHHIFLVSANGIYRFRIGHTFTLLFPFVALVSCMVVNLKRNIPLRKRIALIAFCAMPIISTLTSLLLYTYSYNFVLIGFVLVFIYGTIQFERSIEYTKQKSELTEQKVKIAMSQIQPHFVYNTLNAISGLCDEDPATAKEVVTDFAKYLRRNMDVIRTDMLIPFEQELEHTKTYLKIEQIRFGEDLKVDYDVAYKDFKLPPLTLQPLVENAVKHGICGAEDGGCVTIRTAQNEKEVIITIEDDGVGYNTKSIGNDGKPHLGIRNVKQRLSSMCKGSVEITSEIGKGTVVKMMLPKEELR